MCRHLAYLGPPVSLREAIIDPPYGLYRQAWAPKMMRGSGTMNIDGFGAGWYADGDPVPARYRNSGPIWADPSFADLTRVTRSRALLAAVRDASAGTEPSPSAASPFGADHWLFSHNGALVGWPGTAAGLAATLSPLELLNLDARVDSALLWALTLKRLREGARPGAALAAVMGLLDVAGATGRFNFLLTDGHVIAGTTAGHSLFYRQAHTGGADSVTVASEPADDDPAWTEIPDRSLVTATATGVEILPLPVPPEVTADDAERVQHGSFPEGMAATSGPDGRNPSQ
jgi:gamma-glutamyl hercynylcysteine S-oxide hydrolase